VGDGAGNGTGDAAGLGVTACLATLSLGLFGVSTVASQPANQIAVDRAKPGNHTLRHDPRLMLTSEPIA
jgi:hypothetical protein